LSLIGGNASPQHLPPHAIAQPGKPLPVSGAPIGLERVAPNTRRPSAS
jgi:hypothetical protein